MLRYFLYNGLDERKEQSKAGENYHLDSFLPLKRIGGDSMHNV